MNQCVEAIYEGGVLRPLQPLSLKELQRVNLSISDLGAGRRVDPDRQLEHNFLERIRAEVSSLGAIPTIEEVRVALSPIAGSLSSDVISERGEY